MDGPETFELWQFEAKFLFAEVSQQSLSDVISVQSGLIFDQKAETPSTPVDSHQNTSSSPNIVTRPFEEKVCFQTLSNFLTAPKVIRC